MTKDPNFLLGSSFALLSQIRSYLIKKEDVEGVELIEDQYQKIKNSIETYYCKPEKKDER